MFGAESDTIPAMLKNADVILTTRLDGFMVGVSLAITDSAYCTYLSDLAVAEKYQRQGIGEELVQRTHEATGLVPGLLAPASRGFTKVLVIC